MAATPAWLQTPRPSRDGGSTWTESCFRPGVREVRARVEHSRRPMLVRTGRSLRVIRGYLHDRGVRRRSGRGWRGVGGASAGPGPEHTLGAWRSCATLPRSVRPTESPPGDVVFTALALTADEKGWSRVGAAGRPCQTPRREEGARRRHLRQDQRAACLEQHAHNIPGVSGHLIKTVRFLWRPSFHTH